VAEYNLHDVIVDTFDAIIAMTKVVVTRRNPSFHRSRELITVAYYETFRLQLLIKLAPEHTLEFMATYKAYINSMNSTIRN
jgi:hypothetical protein